jgi:hypothetical protein
VSIHPDDSKTGLTQFFEFIWGETEGWVYLPTKDSSDQWRRVFFEWPKHKRDIVTHVEVNTAEGKDVYYAPAIFEKREGEKPNAQRDSVKGSQVLWCEFDGNAPGSWPPENVDNPPDALPSLRIQSSVEGHEHVYWRLESFTNDLGFIEDSNRSLAYTLKADTSGWDLGQVLRPPYTTNYKHNDSVTIIEESERRYPSSAFTGLTQYRQLVSDAIDTDALPEVTRVIAKYKWDDEHFELYMRKTIPEGERSSALMRVGFFGAESGMSDAEIYSLLLNADDRWGKFRNRSDRKRRLLDIVNKARQKHPVALTSPEGLLRAASGDDSIDTAPRYIYGFESLVNAEFHIEWAIEGLLEVGGIGVISSAPGVGKTQFSTQLGIHAALGKPFLDWKATRKMKILFFSLEMNRVTIKYIAGQMAAGISPSELQALERNFQFITLGETMPLDMPDGRNFIERLLDEYKPDGIVIDSLGKTTLGSLADELKVKQINEYLVKLRNRYNCFIWIIHHNRKATENNKKPTDLGDLYGQVYVATEASVVLTLWDNKDGTIEVNMAKTRFSEPLKPFNIKRDSTLNFVLASSGPVGEGLLNAADTGPEIPGRSESTKSVFDI